MARLTPIVLGVMVFGFVAGAPPAAAASNTPTLFGAYDSVGYARDVSAIGNYAYVADDVNGTILVDIEQPSAPFLVNTYYTGGAATAVSSYRVASTYAVMGKSIELISNLGEGGLRRSTPPYGGTGTLEVSALVEHDVAGEGIYLFVGVDDVSGTSDGIHVLYETGVGPFTYVGGVSGMFGGVGPNSLVVSGRYLYATTAKVSPQLGPLGQLLVIDIQNPAAPVLVGAWTEIGASPTGVAVSGTVAYVNDSLLGVLAIDVSNPALPTPLSSHTGRVAGGAILAQGNLVYASSSTTGDVTVFDASERATLTPIETIDLPGAFAWGMAFHDQFLLVANGEKGVQIVDTTNVGNPTLSYLKVTRGNRVELRSRSASKAVRPFGGTYKGDILAAKVDFGTIPGLLFITVPRNKNAAGKIVVYDQNFKVLQRLKPFSKTMKGGFNYNIVAAAYGTAGSPPDRVYLAVAPRSKGYQVRLYRVTPAGLQAAGILTAGTVRQRGEVVVQFSKTGSGPERLITAIQGKANTTRVWAFDNAKNAWVRDRTGVSGIRFSNGRFVYSR